MLSASRANSPVRRAAKPDRYSILTQIDGLAFAKEWQSRVYGEIEGLRIPIINRECLIQNKVAAGRPKDLADVDAL